MQRKISHDKTNNLKTFLVLIGISPIIMLAILWNNFSLQGIQTFIMIAFVLAHMFGSLWYARQFNTILFDNDYMYIRNNHAVKKVRLEHIEKLLPMHITFPVGRSKVYPVTIYYSDKGTTSSVQFISMAVDREGNSEDIPYLQLFRQVIAMRKSESL